MTDGNHEDLLSLQCDEELTALIRSEAILEECSEEDIIKRAFSLYELAAQEMRTGGTLAIVRKNGQDEPGVGEDCPLGSVPIGNILFSVIIWEENGGATN